MRYVRFLLVAALLASLSIAACSPKTPAPQTPSNPEGIDVRFSPKGGCTDAVVAELNRARSGILIQAYSFTSAPIAKALVEARKRGVRVEAILDKSNRTDKYSAATFLKNQGGEVLIDAKHAIAHNKIMIVDEKVLLTGSFNFTNNAEESNAENLLVIRDNPALIAKYLANFAEHRKHSEPYEPTSQPSSITSASKREPTTHPANRKAKYVGSRTSTVYHYPDCSAVRTISPQNRIEYSSPPQGKRLHQGCPE